MIEIKITFQSVDEVKTIKTALDNYKDVLEKDRQKPQYNYGEVQRIVDDKIKEIDNLREMFKGF